MWLRKMAGTALSAMLITGLSMSTGGAARAASADSCHGAAGCSGASPSNCQQDAVKVEDRSVPETGDIDLWESPSCGTAWATLSLAGTASPMGLPQLAEIFYESPEGGPEQFSTAAWDRIDGDIATTTMVPASGSVKACGGNADASQNGDAFDEDPQGIDGLFESPSNYDDNTDAACTLWH